jgi:hypothetical protein
MFHTKPTRMISYYLYLEIYVFVPL